MCVAERKFLSQHHYIGSLTLGVAVDFVVSDKGTLSA